MQTNSQKTDIKQTEISIIGCGIAGITTAFYLGKKGYNVNLIDPIVNSKINNLNPKNGTQASLGVLMGNIYKRSKGRGFLLRNKSMRLWREWLAQRNYSNSGLIFEKPFVKLANSMTALKCFSLKTSLFPKTILFLIESLAIKLSCGI